MDAVTFTKFAFTFAHFELTFAQFEDIFVQLTVTFAQFAVLLQHSQVSFVNPSAFFNKCQSDCANEELKYTVSLIQS